MSGTCKTCVFSGRPSYKFPCSECNPTDGASNYTPIKAKQTNADRIRAMSDEELARFMTSIQTDVLEKAGKAVGYPGTLVKDSDIADSEVRWHDWLRREADNG